ncbi:hypothetical protein SAMN03097699_0764 [Flavobacteriaceae bacterium MAR_2010_188]|nr:hypothetical protein SAMN03097699_0764 [Flavobacteriaceae bacterium MAR_2010_188]
METDTVKISHFTPFVGKDLISSFANPRDLTEFKSGENEKGVKTYNDEAESLIQVNNLLSSLFEGGVNLNLSKKYDSVLTVQCKILNITELEVSLECLVDSDELIFETKTFNLYHFSKIPNLREGQPILLIISERPGVINLEIFSGSGIVDEEVFDTKQGWDEIKEGWVDDDLSGW